MIKNIEYRRCPSKYVLKVENFEYEFEFVRFLCSRLIKWTWTLYSRILPLKNFMKCSYSESELQGKENIWTAILILSHSSNKIHYRSWGCLIPFILWRVPQKYSRFPPPWEKMVIFRNEIMDFFQVSKMFEIN